ncbi:MAG: T9SS type A sorting domain-containing protein [Mariniphaga sp.]
MKKESLVTSKLRKPTSGFWAFAFLVAFFLQAATLSFAATTWRVSGLSSTGGANSGVGISGTSYNGAPSKGLIFTAGESGKVIDAIGIRLIGVSPFNVSSTLKLTIASVNQTTPYAMTGALATDIVTFTSPSGSNFAASKEYTFGPTSLVNISQLNLVAGTKYAMTVWGASSAVATLAYSSTYQAPIYTASETGGFTFVGLETANSLTTSASYFLAIGKTAAEPPTITSFTPTTAGTGTTVTITGTNFTGASAVSFGGTAASSFTIVSATSITVVVASGTTGTISVTTPGGTVNSADPFTFIHTWTGATSSAWNTNGNWDSFIVPSSADDVIIPNVPNDPIIGAASVSAEACNNLTIESGAVLTISAGKALTVNSTLTNTAGITGLIIKSDGTGTGSLKIVGTTSASATVERIMEPTKWHIVSAPAIEDLGDFLTRNKAIPYLSSDATILGMKDYNTNSNIWNVPFTTATSGSMVTGKGYLVRTAVVAAEATILNFNGTLNVGTKNVTVSLSGTNGWNCIGNPYTSAIKLSDGTVDATGLNNFLDVNSTKMDNISFGAYVYTGTGSANGYEVINYAAPYLGVDTYASLGQGFFVKAKTDGLTIAFTPAMQFHISEGVAPFKAAAKQAPSIKLKVTNGVASASTNILFIDDATKGLDKGYDAGILKADPSFALYTKLVEPFDAEFQLQCLPTNQYDKLIIPIGIDSKAAGEIVFTVETVQLDPTCIVILEDKLTNTFTDLSKESYKAAVLADTKGADRFYLHTSDIISGLEDPVLPDKLTAYAKGNKEIRVLGEVGDGAVATLVNGLGQVVLTKKLGAGSLNIIGLPNLTSGLYMLNINDKGASQTIKVMVRK